MSKNIIIKLTRSGSRSGPFDIFDQSGNVIAENVPKSTLIIGKGYIVDDSVALVTIKSTGKCNVEVTKRVGVITPIQIASDDYIQTLNACLWRHLTDIQHYNYFYGVIEPYVIEYPFSYQYQDEILQNVKDYSKTYQYIPDGTGVFNYSSKIEVDNLWFNKAVVYNGQQSSGILELIAKPQHNLKEYLRYPIYGSSSKQILFTKSDNFYQYNTFWSVVKNKAIPLFTTSCESLSIDKVVNQDNMDYTYRSFRKEPLRAKDLKIRHILDNKSDVHIVSQFIIHGAMASYK